MAEELGKEYRPVNVDFLDEAGNDFDLFYKTTSVLSAKYVKFTGGNHKEKILQMLEKGMCENVFYIHETELFKYYNQATKSLRSFVTDDSIPVKEKTQKVYDVSKGIMKDFFEHSATGKILEASTEVMGIMNECLTKNAVGFHAISQITNKDYYTYTHSVNVGLYCMTFGVKSKMKPEIIQQLGLGGMLHDVGKSKVPAELINKDGKLTEEEFFEIQKHAPLGFEMLVGMKCYGPCVTAMAGQHHEKYKGGGYPRGLYGEEISYYARICKIMDVYDALTTRRSYKKAMTALDALTLMKRQMSGDFDPELLGKFILLMGPGMR
jgi:HD-GYP domain-containing protein (c-di-GMP phosphodiesterase class II)